MRDTVSTTAREVRTLHIDIDMPPALADAITAHVRNLDDVREVEATIVLNIGGVRVATVVPWQRKWRNAVGV